MEIILNFKTYQEATGSRSEELIHICNRVKHAPISACVQGVDLFRLSMLAKFPLFIQHVDAIEPGRNTGFISAEVVKANGGTGVLLNHSEHRLSFGLLKKTIERCKKNGLKILVCSSSLSEAKKIVALDVDGIAYEDPKFIASGIPVTSKPAYVKKFVRTIRDIFPGKIICGAGISKKEDVLKVKELGYDGVLIASAFVLDDDPELFLKKIVE